MNRFSLALTLLLAAVLPLLLCGCRASSSTAANIQVVDGCMLEITGISSEQASDIVKSWDFDKDCELEVRREFTSKEDSANANLE